MRTSRILLVVALPSLLVARASGADEPRGGLTAVPSANPKVPGSTSPNVLSPELIETVAAQGSNALENPAAVPLGNGSMLEITHYGYQNDGDNEITGMHVSNGDPSADGILGAQIPVPFRDGWRAFFTQQHGDNVTWELLPRPTAR